MKRYKTKGRIVLFSANTKGGIVQFVMAIYKTLYDLGFQVICFIPSNADITIDDKYHYNLFRYALDTRGHNKISRFIHKEKSIKRVAQEILHQKPELVWFLDDPLLSVKVALQLNRKVRMLLTLHDGGMRHPTNDKAFMTVARQKYKSFLDKRIARQVGDILFLSEYSSNWYTQTKRPIKAKIHMMKLPAHIPECRDIVPQEMCNEIDYYLFFGRIDKYKGLSTLLLAYNDFSQSDILLVVAGSGQLTNYEQKLAESNRKVILINRFIEDGEMNWLIRNARAVVLPYIEATQSGVIPIAYAYGVPVITSDTEGLTQTVEDGKTGIVCHEIGDYVHAFVNLSNDGKRAEMSAYAIDYYNNQLKIEKNIIPLLAELGLK